MAENYIAKKILEDARNHSDAIIKDAKVKASEKLSAAKKQLELDQVAALAHAKIKHEKQAEHQKTLAEIEVRKANLIKKHFALDEIFASAKAELLKPTKYNALIDELIKKYAREGDTIDTNTEGVILSNANYELKLTLDELLKNFRAQHEEQVAKILWGG